MKISLTNAPLKIQNTAKTIQPQLLPSPQSPPKLTNSLYVKASTMIQN